MERNQAVRVAMIGCKGIPAAAAFGGGIETHVEELSRRLVERGHHVTVYVRPYTNPDRKTHWKGVRLITLPTIRSKNLDAITHTFFSTIHVLFQDVDVIHYHGVGPSTLAWIPRIFKPWSRVVVTFHSRDQFHEKWGAVARAYLAYGEWTAVTFPHATIAVSHVQKLFAQKMYGRDVAYIPNGVEASDQHPGSDHLSEFGLEPNRYFYTLSRLTTHKAVDDAIAAFTRVETDMKLAVIGSPGTDDETYHEKLIQLAANDGRILLLGRLTGKPLDQIMSNAYAMIHPSHAEGLSVSILEAMSRGKLVVMSDIPENLELVDHSGIAFKVGDIASLSETLQWLISDPKLIEERGKRARDIIQKLYSWDSVIDRVVRLYRSLIA